MCGKSHVLMNVTTAVVAVDTYILLSRLDSNSFLRAGSDACRDFLISDSSLPVPVFLAISLFLYIIGGLLPDVDLHTSALGRFIHLPFEHRTWTHAIWWPALLCGFGVLHRFLFYLGIGMFIHDFWDAFTPAGINWLYPIKSRFIKVSFYRSSGISELIVDIVVLGLCLIYTFIALQSCYHFFNLVF